LTPFELTLVLWGLWLYYFFMTEKVINHEKLSDKREIIIFIGPEGSGKSTIARRLARDLEKPYVTTGDTIRDLAANDPGELGEKCRAMFAEHAYLDGQTLLRILVDRFSKEDTRGGFVLDGGLRTLEETVDFLQMLDEADRNMPVTVVLMRIPGWMSFERLVWGNDPRQREDDTEEAVLSRLSKYYDQLGRRVGVIENTPSWMLLHVDATQDIDKVYREVWEELGLNGKI